MRNSVIMTASCSTSSSGDTVRTSLDMMAWTGWSESHTPSLSSALVMSLSETSPDGCRGGDDEGADVRLASRGGGRDVASRSIVATEEPLRFKIAEICIIAPPYDASVSDASLLLNARRGPCAPVAPAPAWVAGLASVPGEVLAWRRARPPAQARRPAGDRRETTPAPPARTGAVPLLAPRLQAFCDPATVR